MSKFTRYCGVAGLILLVFGIAAQPIVADDLYFVVLAQLGLSLVLILWFLFRGGLQFLGSTAVKRAAGFGVGAGMYAVLFIGILVVVNYIAYRHEFLHYDSTEQKIYTLAPQTVKVLANLQQPLSIHGFYVAGSPDPLVRDLLDRLKKQSSKIAVTIVDPEKHPTLVEKFKIREAGTLHFELVGDDSNRSTTVTREISEETVINAILKLTRGGAKTVYYLQGHGEPDFNETTQAGFSFLKDAIKGENLKFKELSFATTGKVPDDAVAVVIIAPRTQLLENETKALQSYLDAGGNALLIYEANTTDDLPKIAATYGINVRNDIIVDQVMRLYAGPSLGVQPMISEYGNHLITKDFYTTHKGTVFSTASSVTKSAEAPETVTVTELVLTSPESWAEQNLELIYGDDPQAELEDDDIRGPVSIAAAAEKELTPGADEKPRTSRIVVIGDRDFAANINIDQLFNRDFVLNALNWVVGEQEGISVRAGTMRRSMKGLSAQQFNKVFLLTVILLPEVLLLLGFAVWLHRKE